MKVPTDDLNEPATVVEMPTRRPGDDDYPFPARERSSGRYCAHRGTTIDRHHRSVECARCGAPMDAFDVLARIAAEWRNRWHEKLAHERATEALEKLLVREGARISVVITSRAVEVRANRAVLCRSARRDGIAAQLSNAVAGAERKLSGPREVR